MAATIISDAEFPGVTVGTAQGTVMGDVVRSTPIHPMLLVNSQNPASLIGMKYSHHRSTDSLVGPRPPDSFVRIAMLVAGGPWRQRIWNQRSRVELRLKNPGDFVAWEPGVWHEWTPEGDATMLTLSFQRT